MILWHLYECGWLVCVTLFVAWSVVTLAVSLLALMSLLPWTVFRGGLSRLAAGHRASPLFPQLSR